jgi:hypothetical protein
VSLKRIENGKECEKALMYLATQIQRAVNARYKKDSDAILLRATTNVQAHLIATTT